MAYFIQALWQARPEVGGPRKHRRPCWYQAYVPDLLADLTLVLPGDALADVSDAERAVADLNAETPGAVNLEALSRLLMRAESIASSRIEGLEVSGRRLARYEAARATGARVSDATAESVLGNVTAMSHAVETVAGADTIGVDDVLAIHRSLMDHTRDSELGGVIRSTQNWIGGSGYNPCSAHFVPPPPEHVHPLLVDLCSYLNTDDHPPLVQAAIAHAQFETIHPFADGNGRTGRALIHVVLRRRGLATRYVPPVSLVLATNAASYIDALMGYRYVGEQSSAEAQEAVAGWIATFSDACTRAARDAETFAHRLDELEANWRKRAGVRRNSAADRLLRSLPGAPIVTASTAAKLTRRSEVAANNAVAQLLQAGVLRQITIGRRNRAFEAPEVLDALTGFERALASPSGETRLDPPVRRVPARPARRHGEH